MHQESTETRGMDIEDDLDLDVDIADLNLLMAGMTPDEIETLLYGARCLSIKYKWVEMNRYQKAAVLLALTVIAVTLVTLFVEDWKAALGLVFVTGIGAGVALSELSRRRQK